MMLVWIGNIHTVYAGSIDDALPRNMEDLVLDEVLYYNEEFMQKTDTTEDIVLHTDRIRCEYSLLAYNDYTYIRHLRLHMEVLWIQYLPYVGHIMRAAN